MTGFRNLSRLDGTHDGAVCRAFLGVAAIGVAATAEIGGKLPHGMGEILLAEEIELLEIEAEKPGVSAR